MDGGLLSAQSTVYISVLNEEEAPHVLGAYSLSVSENGPVPRSLLLINATDPDRISSDQLRFSVAGNVSAFDINEVSGELVLIEPLDYEFNQAVTLTINVGKYGYGSSINASSTISITVLDVNEPPHSVLLIPFMPPLSKICRLGYPLAWHFQTTSGILKIIRSVSFWMRLNIRHFSAWMVAPVSFARKLH